MHSFVNSFLPARIIVEEAYNKRKEFHPSGEIIKFDGFCPFKEHLKDIEQQNSEEIDLKFALFPDQKGMWRI